MTKTGKAQQKNLAFDILIAIIAGLIVELYEILQFKPYCKEFSKEDFQIVFA